MVLGGSERWAGPYTVLVRAGTGATVCASVSEATGALGESRCANGASGNPQVPTWEAREREGESGRDEEAALDNRSSSIIRRFERQQQAGRSSGLGTHGNEELTPLRVSTRATTTTTSGRYGWGTI